MKIQFNLTKETMSSIDSDNDSSSSISSRPFTSNMIGRIGIDGDSAYQVAQNNGFSGSEDEWIYSLKKPSLDAATEALEAAENARTVAAQIDNKIATKASLDNSNTYLSPFHIDPLMGKQTGVVTSNGYYKGTDENLLDTSVKTIELLFTTPESISGTMEILSTGTSSNAGVKISGGSLMINAGSRTRTAPVEAETTYHLIMIFTDTSSTIYVNGYKVGTGTALSENGQGLYLGCSSKETNPFRGIIHRLRFYNFAFTNDDVTWCWNRGKTSQVMLTQKLRETEQRCIAEYIPTGLTPEIWRDSSGKSSGLIPQGKPHFAYTPANNMEVLVRSTGVFHTDIAESKIPKMVDIPEGYIPVQIVVKNHNTNNLTDLKIRTYQGSFLLAECDTVWSTSGGYQYTWTGGTFGIRDNDVLYFNANGNTSSGGMEIIIQYRWFGNV